MPRMFGMFTTDLRFAMFERLCLSLFFGKTLRGTSAPRLVELRTACGTSHRVIARIGS